MMVTTRKTSDTKVISMEEKRPPPPPKTLLEEVNPQLMCALCRGYYIDATTIVECLHSFCRSCIVKHLQVKSYCPICEVMINSAKPNVNIKPDKALQDIVYKLVPGLFQREMQRRQRFYASQPDAGANATPEQRGEDTERIIFSPEDVISFSLEYTDSSDLDNLSSKSSESGNESNQSNEIGAPTRRYLQCPAVVNISHLKKFLSMKYDIDATHFFVDILYKRVPLPDYYTLMDIAYIYNWKRNEPMRFFYQISDFSAIRDRFGFLRSDSLGGRKGKGGDTPSSPAPSQTTEGGSDASSGSFSPLSHEKGQLDFPQDQDKQDDPSNLADASSQDSSNMDSQASPQSSSSVDVEKSQFLNSFELTAKNSLPTTPSKVAASPSKESQTNQDEKPPLSSLTPSQSPKKSPGVPTTPIKAEIQTSPAKRKHSSTEVSTEVKKQKVTPEKSVKDIKPEVSGKELRSNDHPHPQKVSSASRPAIPPLKLAVSGINKAQIKPPVPTTTVSDSTHAKVESKPPVSKPAVPPATSSADGIKRMYPVSKNSLLKRGMNEPPAESPPAKAPTPAKPEPPKEAVQQRPQQSQKKNSDTKETPMSAPPTSKLAPPAAKPSLSLRRPDVPPRPLEAKKEVPKATPISSAPRLIPRLPPPKVTKPQGDPIKSLFYNCNINIPSSLSITLTDQKDQAEGAQSESVDTPKKVSTSTSTASTGTNTNTSVQKPAASSQVHNYIEIVKIPEEAGSKPCEEKAGKPSTAVKSPETPVSAKGPVPNLKPIADVKVPITKPQTFQQTFLQSLQQQCDKPKYLKTRVEYPKTVTPTTKADESPASDSSSSTKPSPTPSVPAPKYTKPVPMAQPIRKPTPTVTQPKVTKPDSALDLSTPHTVQSQLGPQQAKALETMQSIANLAKKQTYSQRMTSPSQLFSQDSFKMNTSNTSTSSTIRIPVPPHSKHLKPNNNTPSGSSAESPKHFPEYLSRNTSSNNSSSPAPSLKSQSTSYNQRTLTRSPSSSPKLVIACPSPKSQSPEDKQLLSPRSDTSSQSSLVSSSQISSTNHNASSESKETPKSTSVKNPGLSKSSVRNNNNSSASKASTSNNAAQLFQQAFLCQQLELQTQLGYLPPGTAAQWYNNPVARAHFESLVKNMTHNSQLPFPSNHNSKENK